MFDELKHESVANMQKSMNCGRGRILFHSTVAVFGKSCLVFYFCIIDRTCDVWGMWALLTLLTELSCTKDKVAVNATIALSLCKCNREKTVFLIIHIIEIFQNNLSNSTD